MVKEAKYNIEEYEDTTNGWSTVFSAPDYDVEVSVCGSDYATNPRDYEAGCGNQIVEINYGYANEHNFGDIVIDSDYLLPECHECGATLGTNWYCDICAETGDGDAVPRDLEQYIRDTHGPKAKWLPVYYFDHGCSSHLTVNSSGRPSGYIWAESQTGLTERQWDGYLTDLVEEYGNWITGEVYYVDADGEITGDFYDYDAAVVEAMEQLDNLVNEAKDRKIAEAKLDWLAEWQEPIMREAMEMGVVFI